MARPSVRSSRRNGALSPPSRSSQSWSKRILQKYPRSPGPPTREPSLPSSDVLTVDELAALLRVERKTVYAAVARGEIPGVRRIGRSIRACRRIMLECLSEGQGRAPRSRRKR